MGWAGHSLKRLRHVNESLSGANQHRIRELGERHLPLASLTATGTERLSNLSTTEQLIVRETEGESRAVSTVPNPSLLILPIPLSHRYELTLGS